MRKKTIYIYTHSRTGKTTPEKHDCFTRGAQRGETYRRQRGTKGIFRSFTLFRPNPPVQEDRVVLTSTVNFISPPAPSSTAAKTAHREETSGEDKQLLGSAQGNRHWSLQAGCEQLRLCVCVCVCEAGERQRLDDDSVLRWCFMTAIQVGEG